METLFSAKPCKRNCENHGKHYQEHVENNASGLAVRPRNRASVVIIFRVNARTEDVNLLRSLRESLSLNVASFGIPPGEI